MDAFPTELAPSNTELAAMMHKHVMRRLREKVFCCVASGDPESFFDLAAFEFASYARLKDLVADVCAELHTLGWETKLTYGDTALFVYSKANPPKFIW